MSRILSNNLHGLKPFCQKRNWIVPQAINCPLAATSQQTVWSFYLYDTNSKSQQRRGTKTTIAAPNSPILRFAVVRSTSSPGVPRLGSTFDALRSRKFVVRCSRFYRWTNFIFYGMRYGVWFIYGHVHRVRRMYVLAGVVRDVALYIKRMSHKKWYLSKAN